MDDCVKEVVLLAERHHLVELYWHLTEFAVVHLMYINASNREVSDTGLKSLQLASQSIVGDKLLSDGWRKL